MTALYNEGFPVPQPIDVNRHAVLMSVVDGVPLCQVDELVDAADLCNKLMNIIIKLASLGLIHCDFNEFNIIICEGDHNDDNDDTHDSDDDDSDDDDSDDDDDTPEKPIVIDFPQMVSTNHRNADMYFDRDVECIRDFFARKFGYVCNNLPQLAGIERVGDLDVTLKASGYNHHLKDKREQHTFIDGGDLDQELSSDNGDLSKEKARTDSEGERDPAEVEKGHKSEPETAATTLTPAEGASCRPMPLEEVKLRVRKEIRKARAKQLHRTIMRSSAHASRNKARESTLESKLFADDFTVA